MKTILTSLIFLLGFNLMAQIPNYLSKEQALKDVKNDKKWNDLLMERHGVNIADLTFTYKKGFLLDYSYELAYVEDRFEPDVCRIYWNATTTKDGIDYNFLYMSAYRRSTVVGDNVYYHDNWTYYSRMSGFFPPTLAGDALTSGNEEKISFVWEKLMLLKGETEFNKEKHGVEGDVSGLKTFASFYDLEIVQPDYLTSPTEKVWYLKLNGFFIDKNETGWIENYDSKGGRSIEVYSTKINGKWVPQKIESSSYYSERYPNKENLMLENYGDRTFAELVNQKFEAKPNEKMYQYKLTVAEKLIPIFTLLGEKKYDEFYQRILPFIPESMDQSLIANSFLATIREAESKLCEIQDFTFNCKPSYREDHPIKFNMGYRIFRENTFDNKALAKKYKAAGMSKAELKRYSYSGSTANMKGGFREHFSFDYTMEWVDGDWKCTQEVEKPDFEIRF